MLPFHFHLAVEGLRSNNIFQIATLGFSFFEIEVKIEERSGRGGSKGFQQKTEKFLVFHIKFNSKIIKKQYVHEIPLEKIKFLVSLKEASDNIQFHIGNIVNKNLLNFINIKNMIIKTKNYDNNYSK